MVSPIPIPNSLHLQEHYASNQENSCVDAPPPEGHALTSNIGSQESIITQNALQSTSVSRDIDIRSRESVFNSKKDIDHKLDDSGLDIIFEPFERSSSGRWLRGGRTIPFAFSTFLSALSPNVGDLNAGMNNSELGTFKEIRTVDNPARSWIEKSFTVDKRRDDLSTIQLPQSAASFYNGWSPLLEVAESCESIKRLNFYLKSKRDDLSAGVPGRFLHVVMGKNVSDVGSIASTILYAFYLNETHKYDEYCTVPVINLKRTDMNSHPQLKWLLDSCQIDQTSLIFVDEIDLSYYELFGSLKIVLLNSSRLGGKQEALKEGVVEIFNCSKDESCMYPWVENITTGEDCSCCTLVAEKFALISPEILAGRGFSRLLLAGILVDTGNLTSPHCTSKDKYMATLLINGAGRFGCNAFHQILRYKIYNTSNHGVVDLVLKDLKKWTRQGSLENDGMRLRRVDVGMSSIGISVAQLLSKEVNSTEEIKSFLGTEKLELLVIVSGYYDPRKNFKREILIVADSKELMQKLLVFLNSNTSQSQLPLTALHQPGVTVTDDEIRAFEINKIASRRTIERLLGEFCQI